MNEDELNDKSILYTLFCSTTRRSVEIPFRSKAKAASFMGWKDTCSFYTPDDIYECIDVSLSRSSSNIVLTLIAALTFDYFISQKIQRVFKPLQAEITPITFKDITLSSLHVAAALNDVDSVSHFVQSNKANELCGIKRFFEEDKSPLYYAVIYAANDVVHYLAQEVDVGVLHRCIRSVLTTGTSKMKSSKSLYLLQQRYLSIIFEKDKPHNIDKEKFDAIVNDSSYPIHHSIHLRYFSIALYLLRSHIFNINSLNENFLTPLQIAIESKCLETIRTITEYSDCNLLCKNVKGLTPLHLACESGCLDIVQHFINDKEIDVNIPTSNLDSPLHIACKNCHLNIVKFLTKDSKCDIEAVNRNSDRPIHVAVQSVNIDIVKHLISRNCNLNVKGQKGHTPLHYACIVGGQRGGFELVKILTSVPQCDINAFDNFNEGPIHKASRV
ncbi:PREDICTED: ankyrin-1-like, partial [Amphimedon queenslandica]